MVVNELICKLSNGKEYKVRRIGYGDMLDVDMIAKNDKRKWLYEFVRRSVTPEVTEQEFYSWDPNDCYKLQEYVDKLNRIDARFLAQLDQELDSDGSIK